VPVFLFNLKLTNFVVVLADDQVRTMMFGHVEIDFGVFGVSAAATRISHR
jgi:hypothetical protein